MFSSLEVPSNVIIKKVYTFLFFNTLIVESNTDKLSAIGIINQQHSPTNHNDNTEFDHTALGLYHVYVNNKCKQHFTGTNKARKGGNFHWFVSTKKFIFLSNHYLKNYL